MSDSGQIPSMNYNLRHHDNSGNSADRNSESQTGEFEGYDGHNYDYDSEDYDDSDDDDFEGYEEYEDEAAGIHTGPLPHPPTAILNALFPSFSPPPPPPLPPPSWTLPVPLSLPTSTPLSPHHLPPPPPATAPTTLPPLSSMIPWPPPPTTWLTHIVPPEEPEGVDNLPGIANDEDGVDMSVFTTPTQPLLPPENPDLVTFLRLWAARVSNLSSSQILPLEATGVSPPSNITAAATATREEIEGMATPSTGLTLRCIVEMVKDRVEGDITKEMVEQGRCDVQGINWGKMDVTRAAARKRRDEIYVNYTNCGQIEGMDPTAGFASPLPQPIYTHCLTHPLTTIHLSHFQLRNMLASPSRSHIFYPDAHGIRDYNPYGHTDVTALAAGPITECTISTLAADHGLLIAGTFSGNYVVRRIEGTGMGEAGSVTRDHSGITNHVLVYQGRSNDRPVAAFCTNDKYFRVMDTETKKFTQALQYPAALNASAVSPDKRLRILVGDQQAALITDAESGEVLQELTGHHDFGFACDWAGDGYTVATGFQDMGVKIWDARKWADSSGRPTPVTTVKMEIASARSLRFTPVGSCVRALVCAEEADYVDVIEGVTFQRKQTIDVFGEIGGVSFADEGRQLNVLVADAYKGGILQYELDATRAWEEYEETGSEEERKRMQKLRMERRGDWARERMEKTEGVMGLRARGLKPRWERNDRGIESMFQVHPALGW